MDLNDDANRREVEQSQYAIRHLIPDNLNQAQRNLRQQLRLFKAAMDLSTSERIQRSGFIFGHSSKNKAAHI